MNRVIHNQRGAFVVIFALSLLVLLGFVALGIEGGRWYLVRAELAKGVDSACLAGAKNISNPSRNANDPCRGVRTGELRGRLRRDPRSPGPAQSGSPPRWLKPTRSA